jgi:transcriptional regulator with XRE-family HTH domain
MRKGSKDPKVVPMPDDKAFGRRLKEIRKRRQLSQVEVAARLGIHPSLVSQYELGYLRLHGALLVRMAEVLNTTPDEILAVKDIRVDANQPLIDRRFLRRLKQVDKLSPHEKKLLLGAIDAFLSKVS